MSDILHYANLGNVSDRQAIAMKWRAYSTTYDILNFLEQTERKMKGEKYEFEFEIISTELRLENKNGIEWKKERFSTNQNLKILSLESGNNILRIEGFIGTYESLNYAEDEKIITIPYTVSKTKIGNIKPIEQIENQQKGPNKDQNKKNQKDDENIEKRIEELLFSNSGILKDPDTNKPIRIERVDDKTDTIIVRGPLRTNRLLVTPDVYQIGIQKRAIEHLTIKPNSFHLPLNNLLQDYTKSKNLWNVPDYVEINCHFLNENYSGSDQQKEFVEKALGSKDFSILIGPPGSGKTATLIELISQLIARGERVLLVASTHVAIDNILERITDKQASGTRLIDDCGIVPIRIGSEEAVSEKINAYRLDNVVDTELKRIKEDLERKEKRSAAQEEWYENISKSYKEGRETIENTILDVANLVCGTTIGILQAPMIKGNASSTPEFDVMILDEASKTTFQEFLVPALHAKKWIISGDPKQLAPYVDDAFLTESLRITSSKHLSADLKELCLYVFNSIPHYRKIGDCEVFVLEENYPHYEKIEEQIKEIENRGAFPLSVVINESPIPNEKLRKISVSKAIFVRKKLLNEIESFLPPFSKMKNLEPGFLEIQESKNQRPSKNQRLLNHQKKKQWEMVESLKCQRNYLRKFPQKIAEGSADGKTWEEEIIWRLSRMYEMFNSKNDKKYTQLQNEIEQLMPFFKPPTNSNERAYEYLRKDINLIRRIALPSIIDLLMNGFESGKNDEVVLFTGLPEELKEDRIVELSYQHRMHPHISKFSRENIYEGVALNDGIERKIKQEGIIEQNLKEKRTLPFPGYNSRNMLVNAYEKGYQKFNENNAEAEKMMTELEKLMSLTKLHPKSDGTPWSLALLTFYKGQEHLLRNMLKVDKKYKGSKYFDLKETHNLEIYVANVDRFQGHEADFVFLSFVRSKAHRKGVGFLDNRNRLNVAITRARYLMMVFADKKFFTEMDRGLLTRFIESLDDRIVIRGEGGENNGRFDFRT